MPRALLSAVLSLSVLLSTMVTAQDTPYTFTPIVPPGAGGTYAWGINTTGQIVGEFFDATGGYGYVKNGPTFTTLDAPGAIQTSAHGINAAGQIVGSFLDNAGVVHGFLRDGATFTSIDFPGAMDTEAWGINTAGQIVGRFFDANTFQHGFLTTDSVIFTRIDVPGARQTAAVGINESGHIVGFFDDGKTHGFLTTDGVTFTTFDAPGAGSTSAYGINESGQIVGSFGDATGAHGFLIDGTTFTPIDVPDAVAGSHAFGINNRGQIVGGFTAVTSPGVGMNRGFIATPAGVDTMPPVMTVSVNPATLPPKGKLATVTVSGTIIDEPDDSVVQVNSAAYQVTDEYGQVQPSGSVTLAADGAYTFTVRLEASRKGNDQDGRHYTIEVRATDYAGNSGAKSTTVTVPRK